MIQTWEYKDASKIPEVWLSSLVDAEAYCWWAEPFSEYVICEENTCWKISSLEDVFEKIDDTVMQDISLPSWFCCPDCYWWVRLIYEKESFLEVLREYFQGNVSAILLWEQENDIQGFGIINKTSIEKLLHIDFATRPNSFDFSDIFSEISQKAFQWALTTDTEVVCWHQLFLSQSIRTNTLFWDTLYKLFLLNPEYSDLPILLETRYDSRVYPILRWLGFQDICHDRYGYVIQYFPKYWDFLESLEMKVYDTLSLTDVKKYRKYALEVLHNNPRFKDKYYVT